MSIRGALAIFALVGSSFVFSSCKNAYEPEPVEEEVVEEGTVGLQVVGGPGPFGLPGAKDPDQGEKDEEADQGEKNDDDGSERNPRIIGGGQPIENN